MALWKLKAQNNRTPKSPNKITHSLPLPITTFEYSLKLRVCNSVIVLNVSGKNKLLVIASLEANNKNSLTKITKLEKLLTTEKGPLKSKNKIIWIVEILNFCLKLSYL